MNDDYDWVNNPKNLCRSCGRKGIRKWDEKHEFPSPGKVWGCIYCGDIFRKKGGGYIKTTSWGKEQQDEWELEKICELERKEG